MERCRRDRIPGIRFVQIFFLGKIEWRDRFRSELYLGELFLGKLFRGEQFLGCVGAVEGVRDDRMADVTHVDSELMGSPGFGKSSTSEKASKRSATS